MSPRRRDAHPRADVALSDDLLVWDRDEGDERVDEPQHEVGIEMEEEGLGVDEAALDQGADLDLEGLRELVHEILAGLGPVALPHVLVVRVHSGPEAARQALPAHVVVDAVEFHLIGREVGGHALQDRGRGPDDGCGEEDAEEPGWEQEASTVAFQL